MSANIHESFAGVDQAGAVPAMRGFLAAASSVPEFQQYKQQLRIHLAPQPGDTLLDVGCGVGLEACRLAAEYPGTKVIGLDREAMIADASDNAMQLGVDVSWLVGEAEAIPLPDDSVDACMTERVLKYLSEPELGLREITRVLKPGGRFAGFELDYDATVLGGREDVAAQVIDVLRESVGETRMGRRLPDLLAELGMLEIGCQPVIFTPPWEIEDVIVGNSVRDAISSGRLPEGPASDWLRDHADAYQSGRFSAAFVGCLVYGRMPD